MSTTTPEIPNWLRYPDFVAAAYGIAKRAHAGQVDKAGRPYLDHVIAVAEKCRGWGCEAIAAGLLHDVVEDTPTTLDDLRAAGIPDKIVDAVDAVTRRPGETYDALIARAAANRLGRLVKLADNAHNSDPARLAKLDDETRVRLTAKYAKAHESLEHPPCLDPWQRPDGFPTTEYFSAVDDALTAAGVASEYWSREGDWEVNYKLAHASFKGGPLSDYYKQVFVSWRCDQDDEPNDPDEYSGMGWYWVPYSKDQEACGDFAKELDLAYLAEPEDVAAAVLALVIGESR